MLNNYLNEHEFSSGFSNADGISLNTALNILTSDKDGAYEIFSKIDGNIKLREEWDKTNSNIEFFLGSRDIDPTYHKVRAIVNCDIVKIKEKDSGYFHRPEMVSFRNGIIGFYFYNLQRHSYFAYGVSFSDDDAKELKSVLSQFSGDNKFEDLREYILDTPNREKENARLWV